MRDGNRLYEVDVIVKLTLEAASPQEAAKIAEHDAKPRCAEGPFFTLKKSEVTVKDVRDVEKGEKPFG